MKHGVVALALAVLLADAAAVQLVTADEAQRSQSAPPLTSAAASPADPQAPEIAILDPRGIDRPIRSPFSMEVEFRPRAGAALDFSSLRVFYGTFKLDITDRLLQEAVRTPAGIRLMNAAVPPGRHRILVQIRDTQNRIAEKELSFRVE